MMKSVYTNRFVSIALSLAYVFANAQDPKPSFVLSSPETNTRNYVARDYVQLNPGFSFSSSSGNTFSAKVDQFVVCPPTESTFMLSDGTFASSIPTGTDGYVVGSIPGQFAVSPSGAATYTIPIEVPAGIKGMQPNISLVYNSQGGNGIAGYKFNLSCVSVITRNLHHPFYDGTVHAVSFDGNDRYALDGNSLINLNGGVVYGLDGVETVKITQNGSNGDGPDWFKQETKDGLVLYYGNSADSKMLLADKKGIYSWYLNRIEDSNGNYVDYIYDSNTDGEHWLTEIKYNGNKTNNVAPTTIVKFRYKDFYFRSTCVARNEFKSNKILTGIDVENNGNVLYSYDLQFDDSNPDKIVGVKKKNSLQESITPISFSWGTMNNGDEYLKDIPGSAQDFVVADFNGNGKDEILRIEGSKYLVQYECDDIWEWKQLNKVLIPFEFFRAYKFGEIADLNHDGKKEIVLLRSEYDVETVSEYWKLTVVDSNFNFIDVNGEFHTLPKFSNGDFNGDSYEDLLVMDVNKSVLFSGSYSNQKEVSPFLHYDTDDAGVTPEIDVFAGDFDGDGKSDLLRLVDKQAVIYVFENGVFSEKKGFDVGTHNISILDFNNDGIDDVFENSNAIVKLMSDYSPIRDIAFGSLTDLRITSRVDNDTYGSMFRKHYHMVSSKNINNLLFDENEDGKVDLITLGSAKIESTALYADYLRNLPSGYSNTPNDFKRKALLDIEQLKNLYPNVGSSFAGDLSSCTVTIYFPLLKQPNLNKGNNTWDKLVPRMVNGGKEGTGSKLLSGDFSGDGLSNMFLKQKEDGNWKFYTLTRGYNTLNHIAKITDSFKNDITIKQKAIAVGEYYSLDPTISEAGLADFFGGLIVTTEMTSSNGQLFKYKYKGAKLSDKKGFIGFSEIKSENSTTNQSTVQRFLYNSKYKAFIPNVSQQWVGFKQIGSYTDVYDVREYGQRFCLRLKSSKTEDLLNQTTKLVEYSGYDDSANPTAIDIDFGGGIKEHDDIVYVSKGSIYNNKVASVSKTKTNSNDSPYKNSVSYSYDSKGNLTRITVDPGDKNQVVTEYPESEYDQFGNPKLKKVTANGKTLNTRYTYTPSGRFLQSVNDVELGKTVTYQYDETLGVLGSQTDEIGTTAYTYDGFGRPTHSVLPTKIQSASVLQWAGKGEGVPTNALFFSYVETSGSSPVTVWYDKLGREVRRDAHGLNGKKVYVTTEYNANGQLWRVSEPYFDGESVEAYSSSSIYDEYGRVTSVTTPLGITTYKYDKLSTTITSPSDVVVTTLNSAGQTISTSTHNKRVDFTYWPSGLVKTSTPEGGIAVQTWYDQQGNRTKMVDPDAGVILSDFNALGQPIWIERRQTENSSVLTRTDYEYQPTTGLLDKVTVTGKNTETTQYGYDSRFRVASINIEGKHKQVFGYDGFNRLASVTETVGTDRSYTKKTEYDIYGRVAKNIYPTEYYTQNTYNSYGYLTKVTDKSGKTLWEALDANARGQLMGVKQGAREMTYKYDTRGLPTYIHSEGIVSMSYQFNAQGNLEWRTDNLKTSNNAIQSEKFTYDTGNRLTAWDVYSNNQLVKNNNIGYDAKYGNITDKSDIGYFMVYGENNQPPHALTSIEGNPASIPDQPQTITYTDFNKIASISENNNTLDITYGVDQQRRIGVFKVNNQTTLTRYYLGDYEEEVKPDGNTRKIHYISAGNGLAAMYVQNGGNDTLYHCYTDYQGNLLAVTNDEGTVVQRLAYDPWGLRRNPNDWTLLDTRSSHLFARGYTKHEHLDQFGLINMNGRAYDPMVARFLSPDPFIQAPGNWDSYNRYGYCMNNPMIYTDPTGNKWQWKWINPMYWFVKGVDELNENLTGLRRAMTKLGVPDFGIGYNTKKGLGYSLGDNPTVYPGEQRALTDAAILGRTTITFNEPIGQAGANFVANMGVPAENVKVAAGGSGNGWLSKTGSWIYNNLLREGALQGHSNTANQGYVNWSWKSDDVQIPIKVIGTMASFGTAAEAYGSLNVLTRFFGAVSFVSAINTSSDLAGYQIIQSYGGVRDATFVAVDVMSGPIGVFQTPATISDFNSLMNEVFK